MLRSDTATSVTPFLERALDNRYAQENSAKRPRTCAQPTGGLEAPSGAHAGLPIRQPRLGRIAAPNLAQGVPLVAAYSQTTVWRCAVGVRSETTTRRY